MSLKSRLRRLEREAEEDLIVLKLEDGTIARFTEEDFKDSLISMTERAKAYDEGREVPPATPLTEALRYVTNLQELVPIYGTWLLMFVGEDEIVRGERERPGPPVKWNEERTVCG